MELFKVCPRCNGSGYILTLGECDLCGGKGYDLTPEGEHLQEFMRLEIGDILRNQLSLPITWKERR